MKSRTSFLPELRRKAAALVCPFRSRTPPTSMAAGTHLVSDVSRGTPFDQRWGMNAPMELTATVGVTDSGKLRPQIDAAFGDYHDARISRY
jgi:hypothetical protein